MIASFRISGIVAQVPTIAQRYLDGNSHRCKELTFWCGLSGAKGGEVSFGPKEGTGETLDDSSGMP